MAPSPRVFRLLLISDSTGETVSTAVSAVLSQYRGRSVSTSIYPFRRAPEDVLALPRQIWAEADLIVFTLVRHDTRQALERLAGPVPVVPLLDSLETALVALFGDAPRPEPGRQHQLGPDYQNRIGAIEFAMLHDDGLGLDDVAEADVILTGVSRTSKTPTCIYLAYQGLRAANVPLVPDCPEPEALERALAAGTPGVGLTVSAERLSEVRRARSDRLGQTGTAYVDLAAIDQELMAAQLFFERHGLPVIDVTRRSIEETAASIRALLQRAG
ncbi:MAG: pyruvate, water dikinase regulatory protein [Pseudomonadota bacterium]